MGIDRVTVYDTAQLNTCGLTIWHSAAREARPLQRRVRLPRAMFAQGFRRCATIAKSLGRFFRHALNESPEVTKKTSRLLRNELKDPIIGAD
jgi:hypothetical protein